MISLLAHEAIVRISCGIPSATWRPSSSTALYSSSFLSPFSFLLFWRPLIPFLPPAATTLPSAERYPARSPSSWIYGWVPRRSHIVICRARSSRMVGDTQKLCDGAGASRTIPRGGGYVRRTSVYVAFALSERTQVRALTRNARARLFVRVRYIKRGETYARLSSSMGLSV